MHVRTRTQRPELIPELEKYTRKKRLEEVEKVLGREAKDKFVDSTSEDSAV